MKTNLSKSNLKLDNYIDNYYSWKDFNLVGLDPAMLNRHDRIRICELLGESPYDDEYPPYISLIIPTITGIMNLGKAFLYVNFYNPDQHDHEEISKYISGKDTYLTVCFFDVVLSIKEQVEIASLFIPSKDMRISGEEASKEKEQ